MAIGRRFGMLLRRVKDVFMPYDLVRWINLAKIFDLRTFNSFFFEKIRSEKNAAIACGVFGAIKAPGTGTRACGLPVEGREYPPKRPAKGLFRLLCPLQGPNPPDNRSLAAGPVDVR